MNQPPDVPQGDSAIDGIVVAVEEWIEGINDLHHQLGLALEELRQLPAPGSEEHRLIEQIIILLRQRRAQAPTRAAIKTWVRQASEKRTTDGSES